MMELSDISDDDKENHELYIVKLEHELDRARLSFQINESIWNEKEESLNAIISEQKQVISLLEALLKSNQQYYDQLHDSVQKKDATLNTVNDNIEATLAQTGQQIDILTKNIEKTETLLTEREAELQRQKDEISEQAKRITSLQNLIDQLQDGAKQDQNKLRSIEEELAATHIKSDEYKLLANRLRDQLDNSEKKLQDAQKKAEASLAQSAELNRLLQHHTKQRDAFKRARDSLQEELNAVQKKMYDLHRESEVSLKKNREIESLLNASQLRQREYKEALEGLENTHRQTKENLERALKVAIDEREKGEAAYGKLHFDSVQSQAKYEQDVRHWRSMHDSAKQQSSELNRQLSDAVRDVDRLRKELNELKTTNERIQVNFVGLAAREERYRKTIESLEARVVSEREAGYKTISYQIGYALVQSTKSVSNFFRLPGALLQIRQEARDRKKIKQSRKAIISQKPQLVELEKKTEISVADANAQIVNTNSSKLRVAAIMDEFTYHSYAPEADVLQLHPETWRTQLSEFRPDLLFIESAWNGLDGLWKTKISNADPILLEIIEWCRQSKIPSLFWNKEDPVHFSTFIPVASRVDAIFTTDLDCLPKYKQAVGHSRVYLLPFAAQPLTHNPLEKYERKDAFNFAGSYYLRYPERQRDFASLVDTVVKLRPLEIHDRNFDNPHPHYVFPEKYHQYIVGTLPFSEIDKAYKGYRYGINMNTIKQSQTMFARRVFELLASNTIVVSNFSRGVRVLFGELVVSSDSVSELDSRLREICNDELKYRKIRLAGLRKVMSEHTYHARLQYIARKVLLHPPEDENPVVYVIAFIKTKSEFDHFVENFRHQSYKNTKCLVVTKIEVDSSFLDPVLIRDFEALGQYVEEQEQDGYISFFSNSDYYGPNYICDLVLARRYTSAVVLGKTSYYDFDDERIELKYDKTQYKEASALDARSCLIKMTDLAKETLVLAASEIDSYVFKMSNMLALDEFNYCRHVSEEARESITTIVNDLKVVNTGLSLEADLSVIAAEVKNVNSDSHNDSLPQLSAKAIAQRIPASNNPLIEWGMKRDVFYIKSRLPADKYVYLYSRQIYDRADINMVLNSQFKLECHATCQLKTVFEFQDKDGKKIAHAMNIAGDFNALAIPEHCQKIRFGLRVQGAGDARINRLVLGTHGQKPAAIVSASPYLVLTKQYPDYNDLYKYGFLHTRVRAYEENGLSVSVFRITNEKANAYREFEGVDVVSGDTDLLDATLSTGQYKNVLVHLLDEKMWSILSKHIDRVRVTVWVHGAEIQIWQRRQFEFERMTKDEINRQKKLSDRRLKFWRSILLQPHPNLELVFVSQYFADEVSEDFGIDLTKVKYDIVHNYIDANMFRYREKHPDQRTKLLSIRPYASRKYANDLTVNAILELSKREFFEKLEFGLYGDGELFDEVTAPLRAFKNVNIHRRFLSHYEISSLHQDYGVFLTPTRMDSQGVSRDEAMSSGLVPITTNVTAIPEFVDGECGMLVDGEDYIGIANAVETLYRSPELFQKLSKNASQRVARQSGLQQTILKEVEIIKGVL